MRIGSVLFVMWLLVGFVAANQRHYFEGRQTNCAHAGTVVATLIAGPTNYMGVNPRIDCKLPQPSG